MTEEPEVAPRKQKQTEAEASKKPISKASEKGPSNSRRKA